MYWSESYNRVIFPIVGRFNEDFDTLQGWVGRNVEGEKPKYLTRKSKGVDRLYYECEGDPDHVVYVEDILSALKVHDASGYTTKALLTTHVDVRTVRPHKQAQNYLWLDGDMLSKSIKRVSRLLQFGIKIRSIRTELDPKELTKEEIRKELFNANNGQGKGGN